MSEAALFEFHQGTAPLLVSVPHAGVYLPPQISDRMTLAGTTVPDTDWFVHRLYAFARDLGASMLVANWSRYVVDLNRPPDGAALYPGRRESALCPTETFRGEPIYHAGQDPSEGEIEERRALYWQPYHDQLAAELARLTAQRGRATLWDAHSIRGTLPLLFEGRLPDLNFGTNDGKSCRKEVIDGLVGLAGKQQRFSTILNGRFKGGYITRHYGQPSHNVDAIQLEISERAYMDEDSLPATWDAARARDLQTLLKSLLSTLSR